ncbi:MAG TPA: DUF1186 domain-containing protein [Vicinamibacterales bacterium]
MKKASFVPSRSAQQYPLGIIALYGPDNTRATKLVASIVNDPQRPDPVAMQKWTTEATDIRQDPAVAEDLSTFLRRHGVKDRVTAGRIIGCPHEEGIDYPMGRACPRCPFWADIDRFTHEPLTSPPTMSPAEVLATLSRDLSASNEALRSADAHRSELIEPLLRTIDRAVREGEDASNEDLNLFSYAVYLVAKWREPRAYPGIVRWFSMPGEEPFIIGGDIVTQHGARILAAVCDGDLEPIKALILNRDADEYGRGNGVGALAFLAAWGEVPRQPIVDYFQWLAREGLEREHSQVWNSLAGNAVDIRALAAFPDLRRAYDDDLIDPMYMGRDELEKAESMASASHLESVRELEPPIDDVAAATAWWAREAEDGDDEWEDVADRDDDDGEFVQPQEPYRAPLKVGRNAPCPCGSGKKYKKCCGR